MIVFIIYIVFMVAVGFFFSRRKMSNADYVLGGRSLNPWVTAMSAQASDMSGWLLTGLPGLAFAGIVGSKEAIFTAIGLLIGTLLNWLLVARRLRVYTEVSSNSLTISSYLSNRFRDKSNIIKVVSAIVISYFSLSIPRRCFRQARTSSNLCSVSPIFGRFSSALLSS